MYWVDKKPKLDVIVQDILSMCTEMPRKYEMWVNEIYNDAKTRFSGKSMFDVAHEKVWYANFLYQIHGCSPQPVVEPPKNPIRVKQIVLLGSQAEAYPDYISGNHDIDLEIEWDLYDGEITRSTCLIESFVQGRVNRFRPDGTTGKECFIDLVVKDPKSPPVGKQVELYPIA